MQEQEFTTPTISPLWIRLNFNSYNTLKGKDEFVKELREEYIVQVRDVWYPAACEGTEFVMQVLAHIEGLKDSAIYAIELDIIAACFKKLWKSLTKFTESNDSYYLTLELTFDEITFKFHDVCPGNYGSLMQLIAHIHEHLQILRHNQIDHICHIDVNCNVPEELIEKKNYEFSDYSIFQKSIWKIDYERGLESCYYDSSSRLIIE